MKRNIRNFAERRTSSSIKPCFDLLQNPYPTDVDKLELIEQTNLTLVQVENWFINARRRILQKMLSKGNQYEKMLKKEGKGASSDEEWVA